MSPRAACRLETLGFAPNRVFDYVPGKALWLANGLPREGQTASLLYAGEAVDADPPTCALDTPVAELRRDVDETRYGFWVVLGGHRIVLGRVRRSALAGAESSASAGAVMEAGPSTVRFNTRADELVRRLAQRDLKSAIVTTPNGCLVGVFHGDDVAARLQTAGA